MATVRLAFPWLCLWALPWAGQGLRVGERQRPEGDGDEPPLASSVEPPANLPVEEGGWVPLDLKGTVHEAITTTFQEIHATSEQHRGESWTPTGYPTDLDEEHSDISWKLSEVQPGNEAQLFFDHGCNVNHKNSGSCRFNVKDNHNPAGIFIKMTQPLDDKAELELNMTAEVFGQNYTFSVHCPMCGGNCTANMPLGAKRVVDMPMCHLPTPIFELYAPEINMRFVPKWVQARFDMDLRIWRGTRRHDLLSHVQYTGFL
mmetsp:Transcript_2795/g.7511  ORF Transcript_2795/g.7511 Transcript_2795/m.7511 type:complete len:259 (-) Transcript_2795:78-854(-)|eukprot:CAMPEP_0171203992 /NCGR_PEP_ID=MMETSP0790-20130122/25807_1 /TAXON_ID=2925 /ORGANISM="Alexandrium catenella, Strain OF101" /LENGTH=258 /DNA_ID=CAMNT_0011669471 /DNA_START=50 /DNA_END=826 /DNA_ORIENTATION=-